MSVKIKPETASFSISLTWRVKRSLVASPRSPVHARDGVEVKWNLLEGKGDEGHWTPGNWPPIAYLPCYRYLFRAVARAPRRRSLFVWIFLISTTYRCISKGCKSMKLADQSAFFLVLYKLKLVKANEYDS